MKYYWLYIFLYYQYLTGCDSFRTKRVLHGDRVRGRKTGYTAVNYFAAFGSVHGIPWWTFGFWALLKKHGFYGAIECGGSVLTPRIIQTACHCVAEFPFGYKDKYVEPALIEYHWEGVKVIYIGVNNRFPTFGHEEEPSMSSIRAIVSQKFFVHPKCGKLPQTSSVHVSFDVGLIRINGNWATGHFGVPIDTVVFAPVYTRRHLKEIFILFMKAQPVCLLIGLGYFGDNYPFISDGLRQGWASLLDYKSCIRATTDDIPSPSNYTEYLSWACMRAMPKFNQSFEAGDSGGPVSCNNHFFGLVSSLFVDRDGYTTVNTANAYTPFVSSAESRKDLMAFVDQKGALSYPDEVKQYYKTKTPNDEIKHWLRNPMTFQEMKEEEYEEPMQISKSMPFMYTDV